MSLGTVYYPVAYETLQRGDIVCFFHNFKKDTTYVYKTLNLPEVVSEVGTNHQVYGVVDDASVLKDERCRVITRGIVEVSLYGTFPTQGTSIFLISTFNGQAVYGCACSQQDVEALPFVRNDQYVLYIGDIVPSTYTANNTNNTPGVTKKNVKILMHIDNSYSLTQWNLTANSINFDGGNVGVGVSEPEYPLDVLSTTYSNSARIGYDDSKYTLYGYASAYPSRYNDVCMVAYTPATFDNGNEGDLTLFSSRKNGSSDIRFYTGKSDNVDGLVGDAEQRMIIKGGTGSGFVGIHNRNPAFTLDVTGDINFTGRIFQNGRPYREGHLVANDADGNPIAYDSNTVLSEVNMFYNNSNGFLGVGTAFPSVNLHVQGSMIMDNFKFDDNTISITNDNGDMNLVTKETTNGNINLTTYGTGDVVLNPNGNVMVKPVSGDQPRGLKIDGNSITSIEDNLLLKYTGLNSVNIDKLQFYDNIIEIGEENMDLQFYTHGTGVLKMDNLTLKANTLGTTVGNIVLSADNENAYVSIGKVFVKNDTITINPAILNQSLHLVANGTGSVVIDNLDFYSNTIRNNTTNDDIILLPNGTGSVKTGSIALKDNEISTFLTNQDLEITANGTGLVVIDDIVIDQNTIVAKDENGSVGIVAKGTGVVFIDDLEFFNGTITTSNTDGNLTLATNGNGKVVTDNLALDGNTISSTDTDGHIILDPNGLGKVVIDNLGFNGNTIYSNDTDGNIVFLPNGTGKVQMAYIEIIKDSTIGTVENRDLYLTPHGIGQVVMDNLGFADNTIYGRSTNVGDDINIVLTPKNNGSVLTGYLGFNGSTISSTNTNANIILAPNGTGKVVTDNLAFDGNVISSTNLNGNVILMPLDNGNVGINTMSPTSKLHVDGNVFVQSQLWIGGNTSNSSPRIRLFADTTIAYMDWKGGSLHWRYDQDIKMTLTSDGYLGIGNDNPISKLQVKHEGASLTLEGANASGSHTYMQFYKDTINSSRSGWFGYGGNSSNDIQIVNEIPDGIISLHTNNGAVGIETINPTSTLTINSGDTDNQSGETAYHGLAITTGADDQTLFMGYDGTADIGYINSAKTGSVQPLCLQTRGGYVGIGTATPSAKLHIASSSGAHGLYVNGDSGSSDAQAYFNGSTYGIAIQTNNTSTSYYALSVQNSANNSMLHVRNDGNVGIGTSSPNTSLHVDGYQTFYDSTLLPVQNTTGSDLVPSKIILGNEYGPQIRTRYPNSAYTDGVDLEFWTSGQNIATDNSSSRLTIKAISGAVGIGTSSPAQTLDVNGSVTHKGLVLNEGTAPNVDELKTFTQSLSVSTSWVDTGIVGTNLTDGSYIVQVFDNINSGLGHHNMLFTGFMSWYSSNVTNDTSYNEILLHNAGHAVNNNPIYLRTLMQSSPGYLKLQIRCATGSGSGSFVFKFRRMI